MDATRAACTSKQAAPAGCRAHRHLIALALGVKKEYENRNEAHQGYQVDYPVYNREYGVKMFESAVRDLAGDGKKLPQSRNSRLVSLKR